MYKSLFSSLILATLSTNTLASDSHVVFSCTATDGKPLIVKEVGNDYVYSHGQFIFKNTVSQVLANENSEIARGSGFTTYSIELKNQGKSYRVGFIQARGSKSIDEPGVSIYKGDQYDSAVDCSLTKPIKQNFAATKLRKTGL
ncbi:hypothetical protein ACLSZN_04495 [Avibacterium avium]|uniref:hypothetical protein n=1 Tax=Avibacterium avium TaxID=751 RepID=UPI003BF90893